LMNLHVHVASWCTTLLNYLKVKALKQFVKSVLNAAQLLTLFPAVKKLSNEAYRLEDL